MSEVYFAKIENKVVVDVIVAPEYTKENPDDFFNQKLKRPGKWIEFSPTGEFRKNAAMIGMFYEEEGDVFVSPSPFPSWTLDANFEWQPPTPFPADAAIYESDEGIVYSWDEDTQSWIV